MKKDMHHENIIISNVMYLVIKLKNTGNTN